MILTYVTVKCIKSVIKMGSDLCDLSFGRLCRRNTLIFVSFIVCILLAYLSYYAFADPQKTSLKLAFVVFRHGDRTPTETYKSDPYLNYSWPDGWGALTKKGKLQLFDLGQTLNKRYNILINDNFQINNVLVRSSYADRCIMSASTLLAGLFPPNPDQVWNPDLLWQPIPIHPIPRSDDNLIAMKKTCASYELALKNAYNSDRIQNINKENADLFRYLSEHAGQTVDNITALEFLFNTLEIEDKNGLKLPDWAVKVYPDKMIELAAKSLAIFTDTVFMRRMKGGVLIKEIVEIALQKRAHALKPNRKFFLYSAHDISLINILRPLGFLDDLKPEYGATLVLEVHSTTLNDFEIKLFYYESAWSTEPKTLQMAGCPEPCLLDDFKQSLLPVIPDDWEEECKIKYSI